VIASIIIASYGGKRKIGFGVALAVSLLLSPLIGFICVALSQRIDTTPKNQSGFDIEKFRE